MPQSFKANVDPDTIKRLRRAREALHGQLDRATDDPRHKAARERFRLMDRVSIVREASRNTLAAAVREERRRTKEEMLR